MATVIQKLYLSSPALSYRCLPFMPCSSALLFPTYETEPIHHGTETVLSDLVHTLGMQLIHMPGHGNCFFYSVAYSLRAQRDNITQLCPTYFNDVNLNNTTDIVVMSSTLMVEEIRSHSADYLCCWG
jgi:hypothetical protein